MLEIICAIAASLFAMIGAIFVATGLYGLMRKHGKPTDGYAALGCFGIAALMLVVSAGFAWVGGVA